MTWARIDDTFHDDPRVAACSLSGVGALTVSLTWSNRHLCDGWVSRAVMAQRAGELFESIESELLRLALWTVAERNGLPGYQLAADLVALQPSRDTVERERAAWRRRQRRARGRRASGMSRSDTAVTHGVVTRDEAVSHGHVTESRPLPLPLPVHKEQELEKQERAPGAPIRDSGFPAVADLRRIRSRETDDGTPAVSVLTALAVKELADDLKKCGDESELADRLKWLAAGRNIKYDGHSIGEAIDRATARTRAGGE